MAKIATANSDEPPPQKKIRIRRCSAFLRIPTDALRFYELGAGVHVDFHCELEKHGTDVCHRETGLAMMDDGTYRKFTMEWADEGIASLRRIPKKLR